MPLLSSTHSVCESLNLATDSHLVTHMVASDYLKHNLHVKFHDGFNFGENYPNSYNNLASAMANAGTLGESKCPNGLLGIGALGL